MNMFNILLINTINFVYAAGLQSVWDEIRNNWLGPLYIAAIAIFAIVFLKDRAWMKLLAFVGIAVVVGVLIFAGEAIIGKGDGGLTGYAKEQAGSVTGSIVIEAPDVPALLPDLVN